MQGFMQLRISKSAVQKQIEFYFYFVTSLVSQYISNVRCYLDDLLYDYHFDYAYKSRRSLQRH